jgi:hypothetical protein
VWVFIRFIYEDVGHEGSCLGIGVAGERRRLTVWFSGAEWAGLDATAEAVGVETGALVREAALRSAAAAARDVSAGRVKLRRRSSSSSVPVPGRGGRTSSVSDLEPRESSVAPAMDPGVARAIAFRRATGR